MFQAVNMWHNKNQDSTLQKANKQNTPTSVVQFFVDRAQI